MIILFTFISLLGGLAYGIFGFHIPAVSLILKNTDGVLYALMFFVGISIGMHRGILSKIREYHIKIFIIPAGIIAGSIVFRTEMPHDTVNVADFADVECKASAKSVAVCAMRE